MFFIVYKAVREMHQRYTNVFDQRLAKVSPKVSSIEFPPSTDILLLVEFALITPKERMERMQWTG